MRLTVICQACERVASINPENTEWELHDTPNSCGNIRFEFWLCPECTTTDIKQLEHRLTGVGVQQ